MNLSMRSLLILIVRAYQRLVSPLTPPSCRFVPTCSEYAVQALTEHGALTGCRLTIHRLLRCHPLCRGGYDPVPRAPLGRPHHRCRPHGAITRPGTP